MADGRFRPTPSSTKQTKNAKQVPPRGQNHTQYTEQPPLLSQRTRKHSSTAQQPRKRGLSQVSEESDNPDDYTGETFVDSQDNSQSEGEVSEILFVLIHTSILLTA